MVERGERGTAIDMDKWLKHTAETKLRNAVEAEIEENLRKLSDEFKNISEDEEEEEDNSDEEDFNLNIIDKYRRSEELDSEYRDCNCAICRGYLRLAQNKTLNSFVIRKEKETVEDEIQKHLEKSGLRTEITIEEDGTKTYTSYKEGDKPDWWDSIEDN